MSERAPLSEWRDAVRDDGTLDRTAKAVAFVIATYWDRNGNGAFPAKLTIAAGASIGKRTADTAVDRLERAGYLIVTRSSGRRPNVYTATLPTVQPTAPLTVQPVAPLTDGNRASSDSQPCKTEHSTVQWAAPESVRTRINANGRAARAVNGQRADGARRSYEEYDRGR